MEIIMLGCFKYSGMIASCVALLSLAGAPDAFAQRRLTYEQAWAACIKEVKSMWPSDALTGTNQRYIHAITCMDRYGYKI
jgi:hypothetical protein